MGIRVHKCLGYGLMDLAKNDPRLIISPRDVLDKLEDKKLKDYLEFLNCLSNTLDDFWLSSVFYCIKQFHENWHKDFYRNVIFDDEFGLPNVMLFLPPGQPNWFRYDDTIDWHEETLNHKQMNHVEEVKNGIYPYCLLFYDKEKRKQLNHIEGRQFTHLTNNPGLYPEEINNKLREKYKNVVPYVPEEIQYFCMFLNIFKEFKTIMELKPLMYTYWS